MTQTQERLLQALRAHLKGGHTDWEQPISAEDWWELFEQARAQHVLPMVVEAIYPCPAFLAAPENLRAAVKGESRRRIISQTMATQVMLTLYQAMTQAGLHPVVMKGAACRSTYPKPDARPSSDEDILVPEGEFTRCAAFLTDYGCRQTAPGDPERDFELSFNTPEGLHIELHRTPFAPDSDALSRANDWFEGAWERGMELEGYRTMSPHDHMLYLILHAFKHLIHSGFGIRQVSDILLWGAAYREKIDWTVLRQQCESMRAWGFVQAVFQIGHERLGLPLPVETGGKPGLGRALLEDMLAGGVFGGTDLSRKHSSTITLHAVEAQHTGKKSGLLSTLFPPKTAMEKKYPYVEKAAILLPVAWLHRIVRYGAEKKDESNRPSDSLRIGKERMTLLKELGILE